MQDNMDFHDMYIMGETALVFDFEFCGIFHNENISQLYSYSIL